MTDGPMLRTQPSGSLRHGAILLILWQLLRMGMQAVWMFLIARLLGASSYGTFAGYAGLASAIGSFTGIGFGLTLLQDVSRDRSRFGPSLRHATAATLASGAVFWLLYIATAGYALNGNISLLPVVCIGLPEILAFPFTILASYAYQAHERPGMAGLMYAVIPASNLLAIAAFMWLTAERTLSAYVPYHALFAVLGAAAAWTLMRAELHSTTSNTWPTRRDVRESAGFSLMRVIDTAMTSLDKSLVLRLAGPEIAGWYTAAFRLASVLAIPASALAMAALPRLFRERGRTHGQRLPRTLLLASVASGAVAAVGMLAGASALPWLLGASFEGAARAARCLCLAPLLMGLAAAGANVLATSDRRRWRIAAQASGLAGLFAFGGLAMPRYGIAGAAIMLQAALALASLLLWLAVFFRPSRNPTEPVESEFP